MDISNYISIKNLSHHYNVEISFFEHLKDFDLIEIHIFENEAYIHEDLLSIVLKVKNLHHELNINLEGIDTILNLLEKIESLTEENELLKNRLRLFE
jgi:hypothetical protein